MMTLNFKGLINGLIGPPQNFRQRRLKNLAGSAALRTFSGGVAAAMLRSTHSRQAVAAKFGG